MQPFGQMIRGVFISSSAFLPLALLLWLVPSYRLFAQGLALGVCVSLVNGWVLYRKTLRVTEAAVNSGIRVYGTGMLQRVLLSASAAYFAVEKPEWVSLYGVLVGLFTVQVTALVFAFRTMRE